MPNLAAYHPQIVHFVVALLAVGIALRWLSLTGKVPFASPAAAGSPDSARAVLRALVAEFPMSQRLKDRLTQLGG